MAKYRKKPVVIEAKRWDGSVESATEIINWALSNGGTIRYHKAQEAYEGEDGKACSAYPAYLSIDTLEGTMEASIGDVVIEGVSKEYYPCKPDIFDKTYDFESE